MQLLHFYISSRSAVPVSLFFRSAAYSTMGEKKEKSHDDDSIPSTTKEARQLAAAPSSTRKCYIPPSRLCLQFCGQMGRHDNKSVPSSSMPVSRIIPVSAPAYAASSIYRKSSRNCHWSGYHLDNQRWYNPYVWWHNCPMMAFGSLQGQGSLCEPKTYRLK